MSSFEREFNSAVEAVERDVFISLVRDNPQLTLAELTKLGKGKFAGLLGTVRVGDILEGRRHGVRAGGNDDSDDDDDSIDDGRTSKSKTRSINTRTPEGRRAYDEAVLAVVAESRRPVKAPEITAKVGGTALQVRKSLARLIDLGQITWEGKARGMRYSPA